MIKRFKFGAVVGLVAFTASLGMSSLAGAVTNYPPSTTTPQTVTFLNSSPASPITVTVGSSSTVNLGGCNPGTVATVTITPPGQTVQVTADSNGFANLVINFLDPHISINGSAPITVPYGAISISVSCADPTGATVTHTGYFKLVASSGGLSFTGAEIGATVIGALVLVSAGTLLMLSTRRRRTRTTSR